MYNYFSSHMVFLVLYIFTLFLLRLKTDVPFIKINIRKYINIYDTTGSRSNKTNLRNSKTGIRVSRKM